MYRKILAVCAATLTLCAPTIAQSDDLATGLIEGARWHHIHINSVDPDASAAYFARHFDAYETDFAGADAAVRAQHAFVMFNAVDEPASTALNTAIWHIGWGAPDPQYAFARQQELGADIYQPITDLSRAFASPPPGGFYYMYVRSPDGTLVELNTARTNDFGHIHMYSADPVAAGDWYIRYFGVRGRPLSNSPEASEDDTRGLRGALGPRSSHQFDQVNMIIYPQIYTMRANPDDWEGLDELQPTTGNVNDHIGVSVPDLDAALAVFRADGVTILQEPSELADGIRHAFIEGPDAMVIELLELP